jgi:hypothetical protein
MREGLVVASWGLYLAMADCNVSCLHSNGRLQLREQQQRFRTRRASSSPRGRSVQLPSWRGDGGLLTGKVTYYEIEVSFEKAKNSEPAYAGYLPESDTTT